MKKEIPFLFIGSLVFLFLAVVFHRWFTNAQIIGGDWPYFFPEFLAKYSAFPSLWVPWQGNGLGGVQPLLNLYMFQAALIVPFVQKLGIPWELVYKIGWFGLFLLISAAGVRKLFQVLFPQAGNWSSALTAAFIYPTNTYVLMLVGGGQMGVALSYSLAPLVLVSFIRLIDQLDLQVNIKYQISKIKNISVAGLVLGLQIMFDPRMAYVTLAGVGIYFIVFWFHGYTDKIRLVIKTSVELIFAGTISLFLNAFWLLPMVVLRDNPLSQLGSAYTSPASVRFFSFADFSHALSFLAPNWPENIFGKTYFMQPEFLILPVLAFMGLIFIKKKTSQSYFAALLILTGAFLAKGVQPPFGQLYLWLFEKVPGFIMFRDPTKFYLLIALGYSLLLPYALSAISEVLARSKKILFLKHLPIICFIFIWFFLDRQAVLGQLGGTFAYHTVPREYVDLKNLLANDREYYRTLWVPRQQRFAFVSARHPAIEANPQFSATSAAELSRALSDPKIKDFLSAASVRYVIIPYDSLAEFFLSDRNYSEKERANYKEMLDRVPWLTKIQDSRITIYETKSYHPLFWTGSGEPISYSSDNYGLYHVILTTSQSTTLSFSQAFHPGWQIFDGSRKLTVKRDTNNFMNVSLSSGQHNLTVVFAPQRWVIWGFLFSGLTLLICLILCLRLFQLERK